MSEQVDDLIFWTDLETTGLSPTDDVLLEYATVVTDGNLQTLWVGPCGVLSAPEDRLRQMVPAVQEMHGGSGLWEEVLASTKQPADAEAEILDWLATIPVEKGKAPVGGSSVAFDRRFLEQHMPTLGAHFHYRSIDVSSFKEMYRRWLPQIYARFPEDLKLHRAYSDIMESIGLLRFIRSDIVGRRGLRDDNLYPF